MPSDAPEHQKRLGAWLALFTEIPAVEWLGAEEVAVPAYSRQAITIELREDGSIVNTSTASFELGNVARPLVGMGIFTEREGGSPMMVPAIFRRPEISHIGKTMVLAPGAFHAPNYLQGLPLAHLAMAKPCSECPWRRDTRLGRFSPGQFAALEDTAQPGHDVRTKGCHKAHNGTICAGWLATHGRDNGRVQLAVAFGLVPPEALEPNPDLYGSFAEMVDANDPRKIPRAELRSFTTEEAEEILRAALQEFVGQPVGPEMCEVMTGKVLEVLAKHDGMWVQPPE